MRGRGQLYRDTIARTRGVRGPDAMELAAVGMVVFVLLTCAVVFGMRHIRMVKTLDAALLASGPYYDEIVYRSVHGAWPSPDRGIVGDNVGGLYAKKISLDPGGGITAELMLDAPSFRGTGSVATDLGKASGLLSFRPELLGTRDFPAFTLVCGHAALITGGGVQAANRTTLDRNDLPPFCR